MSVSWFFMVEKSILVLSAVANVGASCQIRTDDPRFTRAMLWPTELRRRIVILFELHKK